MVTFFHFCLFVLWILVFLILVPFIVFSYFCFLLWYSESFVLLESSWYVFILLPLFHPYIFWIILFLHFFSQFYNISCYSCKDSFLPTCFWAVFLLVFFYLLFRPSTLSSFVSLHFCVMVVWYSLSFWSIFCYLCLFVYPFLFLEILPLLAWLSYDYCPLTESSIL